MLDITEELRGLVIEFDRHRIDYALCGGLAMAVHGHMRATVDIDVMIPPELLERVIEIAGNKGYSIRGKDLSFADGAIEIRRISKIDQSAGDLISLDLLLVTPEIRDVWQSRMKGNWEGGNLSVVTPNGLIFLKRLRSSEQDLADIKQLEGILNDQN